MWERTSVCEGKELKKETKMQASVALMNVSDSLCVCTLREWARVGSIGKVAHFLYFLSSGPFCRIFLKKTTYFACRGSITTCFSCAPQSQCKHLGCSMPWGWMQNDASSDIKVSVSSFSSHELAPFLTSPWPICAAFRDPDKVPMTG